MIIEKIRQSISKTPLTFLLMLLMMCYTNQNALFAGQTNSIQRVSDSKELFRALFFLDSELLNGLDNLKEFKISNMLNNEEQLAKFRTTREQIMETMGQNNPAFFDHFSKEVSSGDQIRIKAALDQGMREFESAKSTNINNVLKSDSYKANSKSYLDYLKANNLDPKDYNSKANSVRGYLNHLSSNPIGGDEPQGVVVVAVAVALLVVAVTVVAAVDAFVWDGSDAAIMGQGNGLINDELTNEVALAFNGIYQN